MLTLNCLFVPMLIILQMASSSNPKRMKNVVGNPSKGKKRKERIHSHYFFTKDNEDRFQVVMQRKFVAKRKVILKPGEVNEFQLELIRRGWERLGSYPSTLSVTLVKEFYANAKVTTSAAPTFLSYVREKRVPFDVDTINEFLGTQLADDMECQFSVLDDEGMAPRELIQALYLAGEGFHRGTIQRGSLHPLARFWLAFVHANISPCSHVSDLMEGRATILYTILTGRVMDVGHFIANEIHWCANAAGKAALGHNSLITHLCSLAGVDISVPSLEKAMQDLDFSYFQRFCSVAPRPRRCHQPQVELEPEPEPKATPTIDMWLQALEAKLDHLQLLEPQMQALYRLGMANVDMLRGISLTIPELHTSSA